MTAPDRVCTTIMSLPRRIHIDVGETSVAYGLDQGREFMFGSPSFGNIRRRSLCVRLVGQAGEDGGCPQFRLPLGGEEGMPRLLVWRESALAPTSSISWE
jgi:hypothetical protein